MRPTVEALTHAVEALAREAMEHHGRLRITETPTEILVRGGCSDTAAAWIVATLTRQGVLVPLAANGAAASTELRPEVFSASHGGVVPRSDAARRIAVFVDYPNVAGALRHRGDVFSLDRIRDALRDVGEIRTLRAFLDTTRVPHEVRQDLHEMGVGIEDCPRTQDGETVDKLLIERVADALESDAFDAIAVAANDNDYARDVFRRVRDRQRLPILLVADPTGSAALKEAAGGQFRYIGGSAFMPEVTSFLNGVSVEYDPARIAAFFELHPMASDAITEIIRFAAALEAKKRRQDEQPSFARKYLRDCMRSDHRTDLPHVATLEEQTACVLRLSEISVFVPFTDGGQVVLGQYMVNRNHPLVIAALRDVRDVTDDQAVTDATP